jgi:hypothetical protein
VRRKEEKRKKGTRTGWTTTTHKTHHETRDEDHHNNNEGGREGGREDVPVVDVEVPVLAALLLDPQLHLLVEPPLTPVQLLRRVRL